MAVAPIPPTKPTPPTAPTMPSATSGSPSDAQVPSPVNSVSGSPVKPTIPLQSPSTQNSASPQGTENTKTPFPASFDLLQDNSVKTTVPAKNQAVDNTTFSFGSSWLLAVVVIIAVVLTGLRILKSRPKQSRTVIDYSDRTTTMNAEDGGIDVMISPKTKAPKVKSNFELRV